MADGANLTEYGTRASRANATLGLYVRIPDCVSLLSVERSFAYGYDQNVSAGGFGYYARNLRQDRTRVSAEDVSASRIREGLDLGSLAEASDGYARVLQETQSGSVSEGASEAREADAYDEAGRSDNGVTKSAMRRGYVPAASLLADTFGVVHTVSHMDESGIVRCELVSHVDTLTGEITYLVVLSIDDTPVAVAAYDEYSEAQDAYDWYAFLYAGRSSFDA